MSERVRDSIDIDIDDTQLGRSVVAGTLIGLPLVFAVSTLVTLRVGLVNAMAIAALPTLFSGSYVGGIILLLRVLRRAERRAAALRSAVVGVESQPRGCDLRSVVETPADRLIAGPTRPRATLTRAGKQTSPA
jgi:hypothetical protein